MFNPYRYLKPRHLFFLVVIALLFGMFKISALGGWDQSFYWAQLTSVWYDGDLMLHDDLLANHNLLRDQHQMLTLLHEDGRLPNTFSFGTAVIDGVYAGPVILLSRLFGGPRITDVVLSIVGIAAIFKIALIFMGLERLLCSAFSKNWLTYLVAACVFFGTPLLFYAIIDYGMAHLNSALFATLFVLACIRWLRCPTRYHSLILGLMAGFMILIRWQNGIYALFTIPPLLYQYIHASRTQRREYLIGTGLVIGLTGFIVSTQLIAWYKQFGVFWLLPQGPDYIRWHAPQWRSFLFSGYHGLFPWSPVVLLALVGTLVAIFRRRGFWQWLMAGSLITILFTLYVNASVLDWWSGASYGPRRVCCLIPLLALGLIEGLKALPKHLALALCVLIIGWTHVTYTCYHNRIDDLAVPFLGRPSHASLGLQGDYWVTNPEKAREVLRRKLPSFRYSGAKLLRIDGNTLLNRIVSLLIMMGAFVLANAFMADRLKTGMLRILLPLLPLVYIGLFTGMIFFIFPNSYLLNKPWKLYAGDNMPYEQALKSGLPQAPVRFFEALRLVAQQRIREAEQVLAPVNTADYRHLHIEEVRKLVEK